MAATNTKPPFPTSFFPPLASNPVQIPRPPVQKHTKPCSSCSKPVKEIYFDVYYGRCRVCHLKRIEKSPCERRRFLEYADSLMPSMSDSTRFLELYFEDEVALDEFVEFGPDTDLKQDIATTLHEGLHIEFSDLSGVEIEELVLKIVNSLKLAWKNFPRKL